MLGSIPHYNMFAYDVNRYLNPRKTSPILTARRLYMTRFKGIYLGTALFYLMSDIGSVDTSRLFPDQDFDLAQHSFIVNSDSFAVHNLSDRTSLDLIAIRTHIIAAADWSLVTMLKCGAREPSPPIDELG